MKQRIKDIEKLAEEYDNVVEALENAIIGVVSEYGSKELDTTPVSVEDEITAMYYKEPIEYAFGCVDAIKVKDGSLMVHTMYTQLGSDVTYDDGWQRVGGFDSNILRIPQLLEIARHIGHYTF